MLRFDNFFLFLFTVSLPNAIACHPEQLQCPGIWSSWSTHGWFRPTQLAWWLDCSCWHWHHSLLSHCALKGCGALKEQPERTWDGPEVRDGGSLSITALFTTNSKTLYVSVVYCTDGNWCVVRQSLFENASAIVSCQAWCEALHVSMVKSFFVHLIVEGLSEANWTCSCGELKHLAKDAAKVDRSRAHFKWGVQAKQHGVGRVTVGVSGNLTVRPDWKKRSAQQKASSLVSQFHFWGSLKKMEKEDLPANGRADSSKPATLGVRGLAQVAKLKRGIKEEEVGDASCGLQYGRPGWKGMYCHQLCWSQQNTLLRNWAGIHAIWLASQARYNGN